MIGATPTSRRTLPRGFATLRRGWIKLALAAGCLALLGVGAIAVLLNEPGVATPAPTGVAEVTPTIHTAVDHATPPPADRPTLDAPPALKLSPVAARWRKAVILGQREEVLKGVLALRQAKDGEQQLLSLARDNNARIRAYAFRELGRRRDPRLVPVFEEALADASPYVQENARWALGELKRRSK